MRAFIFKHLSKFFFIGDFIIINLCFILGKFYFFDFENSNFIQEYKAQLFFLNISWLGITIITKPYNKAKVNESSLHFNALTKSLALLILIYTIYITLVFSVNINYKNVFKYFLLVALLMSIFRFLLFLFRKKYRIGLGRKKLSFNTVLIGENKLSKSYSSNKDIKESLGIRGAYSFSSQNENGEYLGNIQSLFKDIEAKQISNIIFCDDSISIDQYKEIVDFAEHNMIRIYMVPNFKHASLGTYYLDTDNSNIPLLKLLREPLTNHNKQLIKRLFDLGFSSFIIVFLLSWLIPIIALIIKIESGESVFFFQKRSGYKGEPFNCIKFRSMKSNTVADIKTVTKNDFRVTKFGAFMRKTSIDELPQFINVFMGDMSVVGPRPHMLSQTEMYSRITKKYMTRHIVKPGITGWAQVMGSRGEIFTHQDMEKRIEKDIYYIQNWSFFLDIKIIFLTLYNIFKGDEQAY